MPVEAPHIAASSVLAFVNEARHPVVLGVPVLRGGQLCDGEDECLPLAAPALLYTEAAHIAFVGDEGADFRAGPDALQHRFAICPTSVQRSVRVGVVTVLLQPGLCGLQIVARLPEGPPGAVLRMAHLHELLEERLDQHRCVDRVLDQTGRVAIEFDLAPHAVERRRDALDQGLALLLPNLNDAELHVRRKEHLALVPVGAELLDVRGGELPDLVVVHAVRRVHEDLKHDLAPPHGDGLVRRRGREGRPQKVLPGLVQLLGPLQVRDPGDAAPDGALEGLDDLVLVVRQEDVPQLPDV
mmetsp:Transcript_21921/g.69346  ORF Transcript_21921/g.69346 Transcript_21921/m.69346 type:complete len:298 (+) Transcript_21921:275-1168(+)